MPETVSLTTVPSTPEAPSAPAPVDPTATTEPAPAAPAEPAAPSAPEPPPAEKEPEPDVNLEMSRRLDQVARHEARLRRGFAEHKEAMERVSAMEAKLKEQIEALETDPISYLMANGKDPVAIAKRFAQPETPEQKEIRLLKARLEKFETETTTEKEKAQKAQQDRETFELYRKFVADTSPDNAPNLTSLYQANEVPGLVRELLSREAMDEHGRPMGVTVLAHFRHQYNRNPTDAEVREALEQEASVRATRILERNKPAPPAEQASVASSEQQAPSASGPNGISNQHAATSSNGHSQRRPSLEERRRQARAELTAALEAEATERS